MPDTNDLAARLATAETALAAAREARDNATENRRRERREADAEVRAQTRRAETAEARARALEAALREIVDKGDYTAPEGMKRIAREALTARLEVAERERDEARAQKAAADAYFDIATNQLGTVERHAAALEAALREAASLIGPALRSARRVRGRAVRGRHRRKHSHGTGQLTKRRMASAARGRAGGEGGDVTREEIERALESAGDEIHDALTAVGRGDWSAVHSHAQAARYLAHDVELVSRKFQRRPAPTSEGSAE